MPVGATIAAVGSLGSAAIGAYGSLTASQQQQQSLQQALGVQQGMFNTANQALSPYYSAGANVLPTIESLLTPGANQTATLSQLPGFQFAQTWGQNAIRNQGTTMGLGGNTLAAGSQYATGLAQQNFTQYLDPLLSLYQTGAGAAGSLAGTATQTGANIGNTLGQIGQAQAAGTLGATNAIGSGLSGLGNSYLTYSLLNKLGIGGGGSSGIYANPINVTGSTPFFSPFGGTAPPS